MSTKAQNTFLMFSISFTADYFDSFNFNPIKENVNKTFKFFMYL